MKNKQDAYFALFLIVLAVVCIIKFLLFPALKEDNKAETVSESVSTLVEGESSSSMEDDAETAEKKAETIVIPEVPISNSEVSNSISFCEETDLEAIKAQTPNIMKNATLADCDLIMLGDSIFVFGDEDNDSINDKVGTMSDIVAYDCSKAGMAAGTTTNDWVSMPELAELFVKGENSDKEDTDLFNYSLNRYYERDHSNRQLFFVLDCCINDYYQSTELIGASDDTSTYIGSYTKTLALLKENFPDAVIICMVPNDLGHEEYGYNFNYANYTYNMYKDALQQVAEEFNVYCLRIDTENGINRDNLSELLEDGTHPNEAGRTLVASMIIGYVQAILDSVN